LVKKAIEQWKSGRTVGYATLGLYGNESGSVCRQVHGGDTETVRAASPDPEEMTGYFGVRFLGIDIPEVSLPLPGRIGFTPIGHDECKRSLAILLSEEGPSFKLPPDPALLEYLRTNVGENAAANHRAHAEKAEEALEREMEDDLRALGKSPETFRFFAHEVMDRYGRFLGYLNKLQPDENHSEPRLRSYNERLLEAAVANPYFIWSNVDPFRRPSPLASAVPEPGIASRLTSGDNALAKARTWVYEATAGVFSEVDPLQAFEVRFLLRQSTIEVDRGEREGALAARLYGAAEALRDTIDALLPPVSRPDRDRHMSVARSQLDEAMGETAWAEGKAMTLEEATEYVLRGVTSA
jgi:endonuclease YncB( thermonuclease family)